MLLDITAEHVYEALKEIDRDGIKNWHRGIVKYELPVDDKVYSPKYVISIAHKFTQQGGELNSNSFGTDDANDHLKSLGFTITEKRNTSSITDIPPLAVQGFTWVPFYEEMCPKLGGYTPAQLIGFLKALQMDGLNDRDKDGNEFELIDIDPFTFVCFLNKFGDFRRVQILAQIRELMDLSTPAPTDVIGLPTAQAQSVWMFGFQYKRKPDDIDQLRALYRQIQDGTVTAEQYNHVLTIYRVGRAKLTEALFYQQPRQYLPINSKTKPYLLRQGLPIHYETYEEYIHILNLVREKDNREFYRISADYSQSPSEEQSIKYYCVGVNHGSGNNQLERFTQKEIWENGYRENKEQIKEVVKSVPIGSKIAAKASYTRGRKGDKVSILQVKNIGVVVLNPGDGITLNIEWDEGFDPFELPGKGSYRETIQEVRKKEDIQAIFFHERTEKQKKNKPRVRIYPSNIILYGPPGTGKTYGTIDLAVEIVDGEKSTDHAINKQRFDELLGNQIEFITFHQNYTYEDFVIGIKPDLNGTGDSLKFKQHEGVFYRVAKKARQNYEASQYLTEGVTLRPFEDIFAEFIKPLEESGNEIEVKMASGISFYLIDVSERSVDFRKASGGTDHTISIATLKRIYEGGDYHTGLRSYYQPIIQRLITIGQEKTQDRPETQNYVLVIDEINRANMSRVFGELITLLEEDKRLGEENEIQLMLPSGESFAVPPNLYIIGTMNTADKSLALLDIALRRRFEFMGKYPIYDAQGMDAEVATLLKKINEAIYKQKHSADYLIGHAYFINRRKGNLKPVFQNRVIPLLMEYFSGRTDLVKTLLNEVGIALSQNAETYQLEVADDL